MSSKIPALPAGDAITRYSPGGNAPILKLPRSSAVSDPARRSVRSPCCQRNEMPGLRCRTPVRRRRRRLCRRERRRERLAGPRARSVAPPRRTGAFQAGRCQAGVARRWIRDIRVSLRSGETDQRRRPRSESGRHHRMWCFGTGPGRPERDGRSRGAPDVPGQPTRRRPRRTRDPVAGSCGMGITSRGGGSTGPPGPGPLDDDALVHALTCRREWCPTASSARAASTMDGDAERGRESHRTSPANKTAIGPLRPS